jgi:hypothetical protein
MELSSLEILNPWWKNPAAVESDPHILAISGKPYYFDNPIKNNLPFEQGRTYVLRGPRQVGKTTLIKEMILRAITQSVLEAKHILFLTCENFEHHSELQKLLETWLAQHQGAHLLLCLDEITFVKEWQRALLWLLNSGLLAHATTFLSGSNARDLKETGERFPGRRVREQKLFPLTLHDYRALPMFSSSSREELLNTFVHVGGFPHALRDYSETGHVTDETYETYANWIFGDAYRFGLTREILLHLLVRIAETLCSRVTYQRLVDKSPVRSHETAASYVDHLESAFLCHMLSCYDPDKDMAAPRKAKKFYFVDPLLYQVALGYLQGIRNVSTWWHEKLDDGEWFGKIFESIAVAQYACTDDRVYFWYSSNTGREADILIRSGGDTRIIEVKSKAQDVKPILGKPVEVITPQNISF